MDLKIMHWWTLLFFVIILLKSTSADYDSSFAYLDVSSEKDSLRKTYCVNFQQFRSRKLPESPQTAPNYTLAWWDNKFNETEVCEKNNRSFSGNVLPLTYYTNPVDTDCHTKNVSTFLNFQLNRANKFNTTSVLFLVERGKRNAYFIRDFLFSQFYNPTINESSAPQVFYMYASDFYKDFLHEISQLRSANIQFYRPSPWFMDFSVVVIWTVAVTCVLLGSLWAVQTTDENTPDGYRQQTFASLEDCPNTSSGEPEVSETTTNNNSRLTSCFAHFIFVGIAVAFVVAVLLLSFFFRRAAVWFFNIFLVIMGTYCIKQCVYYLLGFLFNDIELISLADLKLCYVDTKFCKKKIFLASTLLYLASFGFCLTWFFIRREYYAFYLLDFINICLCVYAIKSSQIKSLRFITFLLIGMFLYDIIMVFGTRFLTESGCSVMLQVVTGMDCRTGSKGEGFPIAPMDSQIPEKIPLLFYVPLLSDKMSSCYDLEVETEYRHIMLGLGDIIVPGYLIAFCFFSDAILKKQFGYGYISLIGYGSGLIATFLALRLMHTAQPALIYLVPFTLIPIIITAFIRGQLSQLWYGKFN